MANFNFKDDDWESIPTLNENQKKKFKIILVLITTVLLLAILFEIIL
tara:strand:+ start:211 stop:351 length:141 start_codon:yes stop_codon:yes gene_type:complete